jgi:hypothetical protein
VKYRFLTRLLGGFFIAILCSLPAAAQGVHYVGQVLKDSGRPAAGATIRVGTDAATGTPLTPLATIYTDQALSITAGTSADGTVIAAGVATADANGNFDFYAAGATEYTLQMSCSGCTTRTVHDILLPGSSSSSSFADNVFRVTDDGDATKKVAFPGLGRHHRQHAHAHRARLRRHFRDARRRRDPHQQETAGFHDEHRG